MIKINAAKILLPYSLLLLVACGASDKSTESTQSQYTDVAADIEVRATNDFNAPSKIKAATFVPNIIAGWATQLVLIDESGALLRTQMDKPLPKAFTDGPFTAIQGLGRKGQPGILIALSDTGTLQAFIEVSDDGAFKRIPVSSPDLSIKSFCRATDYTQPVLKIMSTKGKVIDLDISVEDNAQLILAISAKSAAKNSECLSDSVLLGTALNKSLTPNLNGPHLILKSETENQILQISDGLSIRGIEDPDVIALTDTNLGSTFNKGALLVTDSESTRVVLIARDYLIDVINAP